MERLRYLYFKVEQIDFLVTDWNNAGYDQVLNLLRAVPC